MNRKSYSCGGALRPQGGSFNGGRLGRAGKCVACMLAILLAVAGVSLGSSISTKAEVLEDNWWETYEFIPEGASDDAYVYGLYAQTTDPDEFEMGDTVIFVPSSVSASKYSSGIPQSSAILKKAERNPYGTFYNERNLDFYVDVYQSAAGFDWCMYGSLNRNLTEYNCWAGGVRGLGGSTYKYKKIPFLTEVSINLKVDDKPWTGRSVTLWKNGVEFPLPETEDGVYTDTHIPTGTYKVYVDGKDSGYSVTTTKKSKDNGDPDGVIVEEDWAPEGEICYSNYPVDLQVDYHTYKVTTRVDGVPTDKLGQAKLFKDGYGFVHTIDEDWGKSEDGVTTFIITDKDKDDHEVYTELLGSTGVVLNSSNREAVIDFMSVKTIIHTDEKWSDATVKLRDDNGSIIATQSYWPEKSDAEQSADGDYKNVYYTVMQEVAQNAPTYNVWIDGLNANAQVQPTQGKNEAEVWYYTANVTINEDDEPWDGAEVKIDNGSEIYTLPYNTETKTYKKNVYKNGDGDSEKEYTLTVNGTIDGGDKVKLSSKNKTAELNYYSVTYYSYDKTGDMTFEKKSDFYRKQHVRAGNTTTPVDDAYIEGLSFNAWSQDEWDFNENADSVNKFDYKTTINQKYTLFAHFRNPSVVINGYIRTTEDGAVDGEGTSYRLPNVTISGFEKGSSSVRTLIIETTNEKEIHFLPKAAGTGYSIEQSSGEALTTDASGVKIAKSSTVTVTFDEKVSMAEAQDFLRNYMVYIPQEDVDSYVRISVSDGVVSADGEAQIEATTTTQVWQPLTGNATGGATLNTGYYYLSGNYTVSNSLTINGEVYINLNGYTLTANGKNASGQTAGTAGIKLLENNTLYIIGKGTVNAKGGNAASGSQGFDANSSNENTQTHDGGAGGGGGGAGIGGNGGTGGNGGKGHLPGSNDKCAGDGDGSAGSKGGDAQSMGNLYVDDNAIVNATGGSAGGGGRGGNQYNSSAGGGGGGGGGAGYGIGTGGAGGGGGGGSSSRHTQEGDDIGAKGGYGGTGGSGAIRGTNGSNGTYSTWKGADRWKSNPHNAGGSGASGANTKQGSSTNYSGAYNVTKYNVTFENAVSDVTRGYTFIPTTEDTNFSVPNFSTMKGTFFVGWQLAQVAKGINSTPTYDLTNASNTQKYQPGSSITVKSGTYGDIVFKPVTKAIGGLNANSEEQIVPVKKEDEVYHTFKITTTLDGANADMGEVKLVDAADETVSYLLTSTLDLGVYDITLPEEHSFKVYVNGQDSGRTVETDGEAQIPFESVKVYVKGKTPTYLKTVENETSQGQGAPVLTKQSDKVDGWDEYLETRLKPTETSDCDYDVVVDGDKVSGKVAKYGEPVYLEYHNVTVNIGGNGAKELGDNSVILWNADHTSRIVADKLAEGVYRANTFSSDEVYTVEVDGITLKDDAGTAVTVSFVDDSTVQANYYHLYIKVRLDDSPADMGAVTVNGNTAAKTGDVGTKGGYEYLSLNTGDASFDVKVANQSSATPSAKTLSLNAGSTDAEATAEFDYYTITYKQREGNGESIGYTSTIQAPNVDCYLKGFVEEELPEREGYSFIGWSKDESATDPTYTFSNHLIYVSEPTTLYAVWQADPYISGNVTFDYTYLDANNNQQIAPWEVQDGESATRRIRDVDIQIIARNSEGDDVTYLVEELQNGNDHKTVSTLPNDTWVEITYKNSSGEEVTDRYPEGYLHGEGTDEQQAEAQEAYNAWAAQPLAEQKPLVYYCATSPYDFGKLPGSYLGSALTYEVRCNNDDAGIKLKWYNTTESASEADASKEGEQLGKNFYLKYQEEPQELTMLKIDIDEVFTSGVADRIPGAIEFKFTNEADDSKSQSVVAYYNKDTKKYETSIYAIKGDYTLTPQRYFVNARWKYPTADELSYYELKDFTIDKSVEGELTYKSELKEYVNTITFEDGNYNGESVGTVSNKPDDSNIWKLLPSTLPTNVPSATGFTFKNWHGSHYDTDYNPGDTYPTDVIQDDTLTALWDVNKYKIKYIGMDKASVADGETLPTEYTFTEDSVVTNKVSRDGYRFLGWKVNGAETSDASQGLTLAKRTYSSDITVEAVWGLLTYVTVEVDRDFPTNETSRIPEKIEFALTVKDDETQNITFEVPWDEESQTYHATIDTLGDDFAVSPLRYMMDGEWVDASADAVEHFTYIATSTPEHSVDQKITYKGKLVETSAKMSFDAGDTGEPVEMVSDMPSEQTMYVNFEAKVPDITPTVESGGYTFNGWKSKNTDVSYQPGDDYPTTLDADGNLKNDTLVAQWEPNVFNITYTGLDEVSVEGDLPAKYTYDKATVVDNKLERKGYRFLGWRVNGADSLSNPAEALTLAAKAYTADIECEAVWGILTYIDVNVETDFTSNDDARYPTEIEFALKVGSDETQNMTFTAPLDADSKTYAASLDTLGEDFTIEPVRYKVGAEWFAANGDEVKYFEYAETSVDNDKENRHITFSEKLTELFNTITYEQGDSHGETVTGMPGTQDIWLYYPANVTKDVPKTRGYTFDGWKSEAYADSENGNMFMSGTTYPTDKIQDDTLTAQWKVNTYDIRYEGIDGATIEGDLPVTYTYDTDTTVENKLTKDGWVFFGWKINGDDTLNENKVTLKAKDYVDTITLTAVWSPLMYINVSVDADFTSPDATRIPVAMEYKLNVADNPSYDKTFVANYDASKKALVADITSLGDEFSITLLRYQINGVWYSANDKFIDYFSYSKGSALQGQTRNISFKEKLSEYVNAITYDQGNVFGETVDGVPDMQSIWKHHASKVVSDIPTTRGYTFSAWKSKADGALYKPGDVYPTDSIANNTLVAQWNVNSYKITYKGLDEAKVEGELPSVYVYDKTTVVKNTPTREGYTFLGWTINGADEIHRPTCTLKARAYDADIVVEAIWQPVVEEAAVDDYNDYEFVDEDVDDEDELVDEVSDIDTEEVAYTPGSETKAPLKEFALLNLILTIGTLIAAILFGLKRTKWWALDVALTIVAAIVLILTSGFDKVVWVNMWTILFAIIFLLAFIPPIRMKFEKDDDENEDTQNTQAKATA